MLEGTHLHDHPIACSRGREWGPGSHRLGQLPLSAVSHCSGILSMTPLYFLFSHLPPQLLRVVMQAYRSPSLPHPCSLSLSPPRTRSQLFSSFRTHARTHSDTRAGTPRAHPLPPAALHNARLPALNYSCWLGAQSRGEAGAISSLSPNPKTHRMMFPRDSAPFATASYFPGRLLGQPLSRR